MKVLYFSQDYTPHDYRILKKLAQSALDVWYLRLETSPRPRESRPLPPDIHMVDWSGNRRYRRHGLGKLMRFLEFRRVLREIKPDLIHAGPVQSCGFMVALAGFHPLLLMSWGYDMLVDADRSRLMQAVTRFTLRRSDRIACDCLTVRNKIMSISDYPESLFVVFPWGVDLNQFRPVPASPGIRNRLAAGGGKLVIMTRSLEPMYGIRTFLEAARLVHREAPDIRFMVLGDGSLRTEVEGFLAAYDLSQTIHLEGIVPNDALPDYFNAADLYISASRSDGSSVSMLEAMACRLPVIVTDLPSNQEWVRPGENGWLFPVNDARALAASILEAVSDDARLDQMGAANLAIARERADWERNARLLLAAYEALG